MDGVGADAGPASAAAAGDRRRRGGRHRRYQRRVHGRRVPRRSSIRRSSGSDGSTSSINNAGIIRWAAVPGRRRRQPRPAPGGPRRWFVQHHPGRLAPHGRTGLRPGGHDHLHRDARAAHQHARTPRPRPAVIGLTRSLTTAGAAHGIKVNLIAPAATTRMAGQGPAIPGHGAGAGRPDGRLPRPRELPGHRRDLHRRLRPLRPPVHRLDRGVRPPRRRSRRSRTSPGTGRPSTTRPATSSPPTSWTGRPPSWPTCRPDDGDGCRRLIVRRAIGRAAFVPLGPIGSVRWTSRSPGRNATWSGCAATSPRRRSRHVPRWHGRRRGARPTCSGRWASWACSGC